MNKPITVEFEEFEKAQTDLINTSRLPAVVIIEVLKNTIAQLQPIAKMQYEKDFNAYQDAKKKEKTAANEAVLSSIEEGKNG